MWSICCSSNRLDLLWFVLAYLPIYVYSVLKFKFSIGKYFYFYNFIVLNFCAIDSMYTERFMGLPTEKDNKLGYSSSSLVNKAAKLADKKYLLVHGTLDDNVHYQQSMMLARRLELLDILFEQQVRPLFTQKIVWLPGYQLQNVERCKKLKSWLRKFFEATFLTKFPHSPNFL